MLRSDKTISGNEKVQGARKNMSLLFPYLEALGVIDRVSFDLSLARGAGLLHWGRLRDLDDRAVR